MVRHRSARRSAPTQNSVTPMPMSMGSAARNIRNASGQSTVRVDSHRQNPPSAKPSTTRAARRMLMEFWLLAREPGEAELHDVPKRQ